MNERIKELTDTLDPAAFETYKGYLLHSGDPKVAEHSDPEPLYDRAELIKFAKLIVQDCAFIADKNWSIGIPAGSLMKQYFEVDE